MAHGKLIVRPVLIASLISLPIFGFAQDPTLDPSTTPSSPTTTRYSWIPFTTHGYVGASVGESRFDIDCPSGFSCDRKGTGFKVFTGGRFHDIVGLELSLLEMGEADRAGVPRARAVLI